MARTSGRDTEKPSAPPYVPLKPSAPPYVPLRTRSGYLRQFGWLVRGTSARASAGRRAAPPSGPGADGADAPARGADFLHLASHTGVKRRKSSLDPRWQRSAGDRGALAARPRRAPLRTAASRQAAAYGHRRVGAASDVRHGAHEAPPDEGQSAASGSALRAAAAPRGAGERSRSLT